MADWNPSLYLQFDAERTRPRPTCSRVLPICRSSTPSTSAAGRETAPACYAPPPLATIVGIDNSPAMLVRRRRPYPTVSSSTPILPAGGLRNRQM